MSAGRMSTCGKGAVRSDGGGTDKCGKPGARSEGLGDAGDLSVVIYRDAFYALEGTAAQLTAEGVIPDGFAWPTARAACCWEANGFEYTLRRCRPEGHKGPLRSWLAIDHWRLRVSVSGRDSGWTARRELERQADALNAEFQHLTPEGAKAWRADWLRYLATCEDQAFQRFRMLVPGLAQPKRARKSREVEKGGADGD